MKVTEVITLPFQWGSALRHRKVFHPSGVVAVGTLDRIAPEGEGLPMPSGPVIARLSKAVGTPAAVPDLVGLAWRMPTNDDECWDVLTVSVLSGSLGRVVLRPVTSWSGVEFSSLMPLKYEGDAWWVRARIVTPPDGGPSLDAVVRRITSGGLSVEVEQARGTGDFGPLARLTLDATSLEDVSFDPVRNSGPGVRLVPGWLTELRRSAYRRSREGRRNA